MDVSSLLFLMRTNSIVTPREAAPSNGDCNYPMWSVGAVVQTLRLAAVQHTFAKRVSCAHACAMIHTFRDRNLFRKAGGAGSYLSFTNIRGGPGCSMRSR